VTVAGTGAVIDAAEMDLIADTFRKAMLSASGQALDGALRELGWPDLLAELPAVAIPMVFRLLGETAAQAPLLNDVVLAAAGRAPGETVPLPYAGGVWVVWERDDRCSGEAVDAELPLRRLAVSGLAWDAGAADAAGAGAGTARAAGASAGTGAAAGMPLSPAALAAGRRAVGWWLLGTARAMLTLARSHAVDRVQFGRPIASFQAVRHRLAETLVALDGAEAVLAAAMEVAAGASGVPGASGGDDAGFRALLAKAAAGHAALTAARHCQQVLGGIGFTAEHSLHIHVKRALTLDGLLGSARELTREAGQRLIANGTAPRLIDL
jgi:hypothetical protein